MSLARRQFLTAAATVPLAAMPGLPAFATDAGLEKALSDLATAHPGRVGIGVRDLATGATTLVGGGRRFPMQSVFKFPIGIAVLDAADRGALTLDQTVKLTPADMSVAWSPLRDRLAGQPGEDTVRELLELMVAQSDNTACDVLLGMIGGPEAVTALLRAKGIDGVRVDRAERELQTGVYGLPWRPELVDWETFKAAARALDPAARRASMLAYLDDPRDTSTPEGMLDLLAAFHDGRMLSEAGTAELRRIMLSTTTGTKRLKAGVPPGWRVAHKTGSGWTVDGLSPANNDVGLLIAPNGRTLAIAVFIAGSTAPMEEQEALIAAAARAATAG